MRNQADAGRSWPSWLPTAGCALAGWAVFQFWGNATQGYIHTRSLFWWWGSQWFDPTSESEHGLLVLGISLWLFWRNLRGQLEPQPLGRARRDEGVAAPCAAMLGGLALHLLGYAVQQTRLSIVAFLLFAWGVLVLAGGRRWGRAAAYPLAFLVFAIPLNILDTVGFYLRLGVVDVACAAARDVGLGVWHNGTQLLSSRGGYQYDVAAACSGVRSLMALAALSLLVGYLNFRPWWARALLLGLSLPYTFVGNVVRIFGIIVAGEWLGQKAGMTVHEWFGFLVFAIVLALQLATVAALRRVVPGPSESEGESERVSGGEGARASEGESGREGRPRGALVVGAVFGAAALVALAARHLDAAQTSPQVGVRMAADGRNPADLPMFLGADWIGQDVPVSAVERDLLPPDTGFSRENYVSVRDPRQQVFVSIVLSGRDRTSIHRPELCLVGQGWTIQGRFSHRFKGPGGPNSSIAATVLRVQREVVLPRRGRTTVPSLVAYWFVGHDRTVATHWERMLWGAWDRLRHWQGHRWAYVLVQTNALDSEVAALARLQTVLDRTLPALQPPPG